MKQYLVTYHASAEALSNSMNTPPEEAAEAMKLWHQWAEKCGEQLIDMGNPLGNSMALAVGGESSKSNKEMAGYSMLKARDIEHAKELLSGHPHLSGWDNSCAIEIHEVMPLPGA